MSSWEYTETELWRHGEGKTSLYHVFGLAAMDQIILAFSEAREGEAKDAGCIHHIDMRRSEDGGRSFSENRRLLSGDSGICWANPVPVYDAQINRLFLFVSNNKGNCQSDLYLLSSDDHGITWTDPQKINHVLSNEAEPLPFHLAGPGHGLQLRQGAHAGRLILPLWHRKYGVEKCARERGYCISLLYSDDHGNTWHHTAPSGQSCLANESRLVEMGKELCWLIRAGGQDCRRYACKSLDGGLTWTQPSPLPLPLARQCDAGAIVIHGKEAWEQMLLISRPSLPDRRSDMEILISLDQGQSFPLRFCAPPGDAMPGYSDLCTIGDEEPLIGWLHCRNNHVLFSRISLQALTGGEYENTHRSVWME